MAHAQTVFFIGKPGCGKGTQAELLAKRTGWPIFASGKLFREIAQQDTPVGRKVKQEGDAGMLQPHWFAMYLYLKSLFSISDEKGAIFDGFNRKLPEAELVVSSLQWLERSFSIVHVAVSDDTVRTRLAERRKTSGRADDHAIEERIKEYYECTEPAIDVFRNAGVLLEVHGEDAPEVIHEQIVQMLGLA